MSTGDALIVEHTERDRYWGDGEDGRGESKLGKFLMELRNRFKEGMAFYEEDWFPTELIREQLLLQIETLLDPQGIHSAYTLARQIDSSNISDIEKIDKMRMIRDSGLFQRKGKDNYKNSTSIDEWLAFIHTKYPEDVDFKYQLVKAGVSLAGSDLVVTNLDNLHLSKEQKIEIYRMMAHPSAHNFMRELPRLGLNYSEIRELYLYALQFEASITGLITNLPQQIVNDAFIQEATKVLHDSGYDTQHHLSNDDERKQRGVIIRSLIEAAASHELNYRAVYDISNKPFNDPNEQDRHDRSHLYPLPNQDPIKLILLNN